MRLDRWQWKRDVAKKKFDFQRCPPKDFCTARYEHKYSKKKFQTFLQKQKSRADLGSRSAWEKLSQMLIRSGEIPSPRQTSIDKTNDCAMKSERGVLIGGSDPPLFTVFAKRPVISGVRRPGVWYKHIWALLCRKQATKILDPSAMAKNRHFSRFGRRT